MGRDQGRRRVRLAYVDAVRLAADNRERHEDIERRHARLSALVEQEETAQDTSRREIYDRVLVPFRDCFARLRSARLLPLESIELPHARELPGVVCEAVPVPALGVLGSLVAGLTMGAGASSATVAGVGTFAAASTGTPIASLSGVAATNATLAWLGGGSLAVGGGGMAAGSVVLGGVAAAPVVLATAGFVSWKGRRDRRTQLATAERLAAVEAGLVSEERRTSALLVHCADVRSGLAELCVGTVDRLSAFSLLVDSDDDYANWTAGQRRFLAGLVELVTTTVALMAAPPADADGYPHPDSGRLLADARRLLTEPPAAAA